MRIWLVRHGESLGNVDELAHSKIPDHKIPLTEFGVEQAKNAGALIREYYQNNAAIKDKKIRLWYSPYLRTKQTKDGLASGLGHDLIENIKNGKPGWEDDRLVEQDFGVFSRMHDKDEQFRLFPAWAEHFYNIKDNEGKYYAQAPGGESRKQVCAHVSDFIRSMMDDVKEGHEDMVIVTHGVTMRAFEKRFMHHDIDWFEESENPDNCDVVLIEGDKEHDYTVTPIFKGIPRTESLPVDYKKDPVGGWDILKELYDYVQPNFSALAHPRINDIVDRVSDILL